MPSGVLLMSPWLDPEREHPDTAKAWSDADSGDSFDYLRGVEGSLKTVADLVFGCDVYGVCDESIARCLVRGDVWDDADVAYPPVFVQYGGAEVLAAESRTFARVVNASRSSMVVELEEWADMPHVFQVFDAVAAAGGDAIASAAAFVKRC
jgi:acetyl esterase/lipase